MNKNQSHLKVLIILAVLLISTSGYPAPLQYSERTPINMTIDLYYAGMLKYSPGLSSLAYGIWDLKYRPSMWSNQQTLIQSNDYSPQYAFDPNGNYLYVWNTYKLDNGSKQVKLSSYSVNNTIINTTRHELYRRTNSNDFIGSSNDQVKVSPFGLVAVGDESKIYIFTVNQENWSASLQDQINEDAAFDMRWHPTERQTLFVAAGWHGFFKYNLNDKSYIRISSQQTYAVRILLGGKLIVSGHQSASSYPITRQIKSWSYENKVLTDKGSLSNSFSLDRYWQHFDDTFFMASDSDYLYICQLLLNNSKTSLSQNNHESPSEFKPYSASHLTKSKQTSDSINLNSFTAEKFSVIFKTTLDFKQFMGFSQNFNEIYFTQSADNNTRQWSLLRRWTRCKDGAYLTNEQCQDCPSKCKTCVSSSLCTSCNNSLLLSKGTCLNCSEIILMCQTCTQDSNFQVKCDKCLNNFNYNATTDKCTCENGYAIDANKNCVKCSFLIENCETCSQGSGSAIQCDKCVNNLKYNSTSNKCGCEFGYNLNKNKTCEKIPDPIPDNNDGYIKIKSWQFLLGLGVLVVLNILFMLGVAYCVKKRMRSRRESSLLGSEQETIIDFPRPTGNLYVPSGQQDHYRQYGQYSQYGQYGLPKAPAEKQYFEEKRNEGERSLEREEQARE